MKRTILYIVRDSLLCVSLLVAVDAVIAILVLNTISPYQNFSYLDILFFLLCNQEGELITSTSSGIRLLLASEKLTEVIVLALMASFIFSQLLNREARIILPDKLVLRRRTSEGSINQLNLGILIGNPKKQLLYDVKCSVRCVYLKSTSPTITVNTETLLFSEIDRLKNFYRFSFPVDKFPSKFWTDYLGSEKICFDTDALVVVISGHSNNIGGHFRIERTYGLMDITIDSTIPEAYFRKMQKNPLTGKEYPKFDWKKFRETRLPTDDERNDIHNEIKQLAARMSQADCDTDHILQHQ